MRYPADTRERILSTLPEEFRESLAQRDKSHWYPRSFHVGLMTGIASVERDEGGAYDDLLAYGQHVGDEVLGGPLNNFMQIVSMKLFAKKVPAIWSHDHQDDSRLETDVVALDESRLPFRISTIRGYDHVGIAQLGWLKAAAIRLTKKPVQVKQGGWSLSRPGPNEIVGEVSW